MWQLRRCEILQKGLRVGHRHRGTCPSTQLQLQHLSLTNASYRSLHLASSIHLPVAVQAFKGAVTGAVAQSGGLAIRQFHSTNVRLQAGKDNDKESAPTPPTTTSPPTTTQSQSAATAGGDDEVPVWQNPLHHNNPDMQKMFPEDFQEGETMVAAPMPPLESDPNKVVAPPHIHELAHKIVHLTLLELKELTDKIAQHFDFDDQVMAASYSGGLAGGAAVAAPTEEPPEKKVIFDLKLMGFDEKAKIKVIKEIRAIAGLGLKEAKELVEAAPKVFQKDLKQERAEELKAQLEAVGAQVEIV